MNTRARAIDRIRRRLLRRGWPRLIATGALMTGGTVGFLASSLLLALGLSDMAIRYPIATTIGYAAFLMALRIFVSAARRGFEPDPLDVIDVVEIVTDETAPASPVEVGMDPSGAAGFDLGLDLDEGAVLLIPLLVLAAGLVAVGYTIVAAPVLVAELFVDVFIVTSLARRFARIEPTSWLSGAFRRTWLPFLAVLLTISAAGFAAHFVAPGADSIGDILRSS